MYVGMHLAKFICKLKIVEILNRHSEVQTAPVTIISYKPLNFARYKGQYGSYMPSSLWGLTYDSRLVLDSLIS